MKHILRFIYNRFSKQFNDFLVEDYVKNIPPKLQGHAFDVMQNHKRKLQRLTDFMAYNLHRRMANDPKNSERYQGMFIQLRMMEQMIQGRPDPEHEVKDTPVKDKSINYDEAVNKATSFVDKFRKRNTQ